MSNDDNEAPIVSHARLRAYAPDPPATVSVQNLSTTIRHIGRDAWNRPHKAQPCLLLAEVAFASAFDSASATDRLGTDTVHYGTLSKALLSRVEQRDDTAKNRGDFDALTVASLLRDEEGLWRCLTGLDEPFGPEHQQDALGWDLAGGGWLDLRRVARVSLTVALPKASLLGDGVKVKMSAAFRPAGPGGRPSYAARAMALEISRLRVPTLIGVNDNERNAKQFVVVTVTVEGFTVVEDIYTEIEAAVVKAMEESSFETLEALGAHLANVVMASKWRQNDWLVCIRMEKPTAVPLADCPIVEVRQRSG
ncbi:hypothetical protein N658DRAFT_491975 [Parathielavia hyrcaniae]|uniref:Dihydroneopterin aldolase/epimerase domain-containing protein n=1 Tax=Parathielavia hyrcaniae TaxID=113614 RepID=A0AAN6T537_9PEZI|nr:hypothetical protein N658DRAFT_491975 [Parathielavia hyrcaniae]